MADANRWEWTTVGREMQVHGVTTQRTYFVHGHRVEEFRDALGNPSWSCDCAEYRRSQSRGIEPSCAHSQRVAAAASVDRLLGAKELMLRATGC
jgi:hypothetical protein